MKILQIMAGGRHGGAEIAFVDMCIAMHEAGQQVQVVTRKNDIRVPRLQKAGVKVHTARFGGALDFYTPLKIKSIIKNFEPEIVQTWMQRGAKKTPNWKQTKTSKSYFNISRLGGYYKLKNFKTMDYFVPITPDIKRYLIENNVGEDKIKVINNFAETESNIVPVDRASLDTPEDATVLLTLARLHESKALDVAIRALVKLPYAYLWLAGEGPLRDELEQLSKDIGVDNRVRFLGWRNDRAALLNAADICCFISRYEPFGTVFVQSWMNKTPVIVSDADGPKQFCRNQEDAIVIPKDDVDALVDGVKKLENETLASTLIENGYRRYQNEFTKEKSVEAYLDFYKEILKRA